ncbi:unnamed protein product [Cochlearia groenlandica]
MKSVEAVIASIQALSASTCDLSSLHDLLKKAEESLRTNSDFFKSLLLTSLTPPSILLVTCISFVSLCKRLKDQVLQLKDPLGGVAPLLTAVHKLQVSTKRLTALHPDFLQLCLQAKCYKAGYSILSDDILEIEQPRDFFLYCYYGLTRSVYLFQVVNAPMHLVNAIALVAYKKYILVSLIHNRQFKKGLPKCASTAAQRNFKTWCTESSAMVVANSSDFEKDKNLGLVKQAVSSLYNRNILRLTQKYLTLSLEDIANMVQLANAKDAENACPSDDRGWSDTCPYQPERRNGQVLGGP